MTEQPTLSSAEWEVKEYCFSHIWGWEPPEVYRRRGEEVQLKVYYPAEPGMPAPEMFLCGYADYMLETERYGDGTGRQWHVAWKPIVTERDLLSYQLAIVLAKMSQRAT